MECIWLKSQQFLDPTNHYFTNNDNNNTNNNNNIKNKEIKMIINDDNN